MVDLADRGVLAEQHPIAAAKLGDVADEHHAAAHLVVPDEREAAHQHHHLGRLLDLFGRRRGRVEREPNGVVVEAELAEPHADRIALHADAVKRGHSVR